MGYTGPGLQWYEMISQAKQARQMRSLKPSQDASSWWSRPSGGREVLVIALPLVISSLSWTVMNFIDRMFLFRVSGAAMSASFFAGVVWFALFCLPLGICIYVGTFVSQYFGDRQFRRIGPSMWQGVWMSFAALPIAAVAIPFAPFLFGLAHHDAETLQLEISYFKILCYGGPALVVAQAFASFYGGRGETWVVMLVDTVVTLVNLVLDYLWIFGYGGFPEMGIVGAGLATTVALWLKVVIYLFLVFQAKHRSVYNTLGGLRFDRKLFGRLFYFGGPSGVQMLLDVLGFSVFILLVGRLGDLEAEATTIAFSVGTLAFMPIFGFGLAVSILVGQRLGEHRDDLAARATWTTYQISVIYIAILSGFYVFAPNLFLYGFLHESTLSLDENKALRTMVGNLLCFVATYNLFDATLIIFVSALKGAGDTRYILGVSLVMALLLAGLSWLAVEGLQLGIYGCWTVVTAWVWVLGITFLRRFLQGPWRQMRVIEMHEVDAPTGDPLQNGQAAAQVTVNELSR